MSAIGQGSISVDDNAEAAENAQETANKGANGVEDINSDNKLTPSEKLSLKRLYDTDVLKHDFDVKQLTSMSLPTTDIDLALSNLTTFTAQYFVNMNITETVDRQALNKVFNDFENADKAVEGLFNNAVQQVADDAKAAGEEAKEAGEKAQEVGEEAKASADQAKTDAIKAKTDAAAAQQKAQSSIDQLTEASTKFNGEIAEAKTSASQAQSAADNAFNQAKTVGSQASSAIAVQSAATAKAQSTADSAFNQAKTAIDNGKVTSQAVTDLKDGSTLTIAQLGNGLASKVANSDFASYKTQTANQIGQLVTNSTFSAYQQTTADLISQKVATKDFSAYQDTTAKAISSKVESSDFNTYKTQTANLINDKVSSKDYTSDKKQTADMIDSKVSTTDFTTYKTQTADLISSKVANSDFSTYKTQTAQLIGSKVDNNQYQSDKTQTANLISQTVTNAVNNIDVGGRNIVLDSSNMGSFRIWQADGNSKLSDDKKEITITTSHGGVNIEKKNLSGYLPNKGDTIVISADVKGSSHLQFNYNNGNSFVGSGTNIAVTTEYKRYFTTFEWNPVNLDKTEFVIFAAGSAEQYLTVKNVKVEIGNKGTDWSPAPEDLATSTEFDQLSNAIKLKADSADVTSQISVATQGIQSEVNNKVTDLNTKISQTSDAVQILASTAGSKNLVYNATFEQMTNGFPTGWTKSGNASNETGYVSKHPNSSYQGVGSIGVNTSTNLGWVMFAQSNPMPLAVDNDPSNPKNIYSASMEVLVYNDAGKNDGRVHVVLAFFDANKKRIESNIKGVWSKRAKELNGTWELVQINGFKPVAEAKYVAIQAFAYADPTHAMVNQPMINVGDKVAPYRPDEVNQASITASINDINLKVANADGTSSQININDNTILLDANKIIFNGNTSILNGTIGTAKIANAAINTAQIADAAINNAKIANAAINDAKISNLNGNKIIAGSITSKQLNADDIIANVINGKTINGITITTPNLQLGTNGTLTEDWTLNQATSLFNPKKGSGTMTLTKGILATEGTLSRWWSDDGGYWYGIGDDGSKIKNGSNQVGDNYGAGYVQHNIFDSKGGTLLRTYMDATGLYMNSGGTKAVNTVLTQQGLTTTNINALGTINGASLATNGTFKAALGTKNTYGFSVESQVVSPMIRANSYTYSSNVFISSYGTMGLATSTKANKLDIVDVPNMLQKGYNLLTLNPRQWFDKTSVEAYADVQSGNSDSIESVVNIKPVTGMVAEEVASAGLDDYVVKDENNKVQGLAYDRLWTLLLPVLRDMNDKINKLQKKAGI